MSGQERQHPGKGKGRGRTTGRGRQVDRAALNDIRMLLGDDPRDRDLLIEYLHRIQDTYSHISTAHLAALATEMSIPMAEAWEVVTFYAHFYVVKEGSDAPAALTIALCDGLSCILQGADQLRKALQDETDSTNVRLLRRPCMGRCESAPIAEVGRRHILNANKTILDECIRSGDFGPTPIPYESFDDYVAGGGYNLIKTCRNEQRTVDDVIACLNHAGLRGLGGAGFPAGRKWDLVRHEAAPRYLIVNADEGEPGTFKDRYYLERHPHRFLEGALVAGWAINAETIYIYLRDEYPALHQVLQKEINRLQTEDLLDPAHIQIRRGAGAYICGEESAMIESIEGKRGYPRERPPYVAQAGLFNRPTLVNNVETLYWLRDIIERGPEWFAAQGRNGRKGLRSYSVSGRISRPGVYQAGAGITVRELIDDYCGGMQTGHRLKAYLPGGASGGILPASLDQLPLDFGTLEEHGCFIGSAAIVVLSDQDRIRDVTLNLMRFFADESCGQCSPCRIGTEKLTRILESGEWDEDLVRDLCQVMSDASICGLGQAAPNPVLSLMRYFPEEINANADQDS